VKETRGGPRALALADLEAEGPETRGLAVLSEFLWCDESICVSPGGRHLGVIVDYGDVYICVFVSVFRDGTYLRGGAGFRLDGTGFG